MVFVITADQRNSRSSPDRVEAMLDQLNSGQTLRRFERTAGDEVQGVREAPQDALAAALALLRDGHWSVGVGVGEVRAPLPTSTRAGAGPAFEFAREAVNAAKASPQHVALRAAGATASDADALLALHASMVQARSEAGWEAVDLMASGLSQTDVAERLGISKQAVSQRLRAAWWPQQSATTPLMLRLLSGLDAPDGSLHDTAGRTAA